MSETTDYKYKKRVLRLHFGIKVAHGIFQLVMYTMLTESDFDFAYLDNVLIKKIN